MRPYTAAVFVFSMLVAITFLIVGSLFACHVYSDYTRTHCAVENCTVTDEQNCIVCHDSYCGSYTLEPCTILRYTYYLYFGGVRFSQLITIISETTCPETVICYYQRDAVNTTLTDNSGGWPYDNFDRVTIGATFTFSSVILLIWAIYGGYILLYTRPTPSPLLAR